MLYIILENTPSGFRAVDVAKTHEEVGARDHTSRHSFNDLGHARRLAEELNERAEIVGSADRYIAIDGGGNIRPRFDIIRAPAVGDDISYGFNGDYYPDGQIKAISKTGKKITSTTGRAYYRTGADSGKWCNAGTWTMVRGHRDERNPSF